MELFDTHFHLPPDAEPGEYLAELPENIDWLLMAVASDAKTARQARDFAAACSGVAFAAGVHPHEAGNFDDDWSAFAALGGDRRCKAVGEIGLDYFYDWTPRARQLAVFERFLAWALELDLPVIVHCRDQAGRVEAYEDALTRLTAFAHCGGRMVIHCFSGTPDYAERFLALGAFLGVTGMVTFPKSGNIRELLRFIPPERLLVETDSPYLTPVPFRGKTNHPQYLYNIVEYLAPLRGVGVSELAAQTVANGRELFGL